MVSIEFDDAELRLVEAALHSFLSDFGHEEASVLHDIKHLLAKIAEVDPAAQHPVVRAG